MIELLFTLALLLVVVVAALVWHLRVLRRDVERLFAKQREAEARLFALEVEGGR